MAPQDSDSGMLDGVVVTAAIAPIANATVRVTPGDVEATTGADGKFALGPLATGSYRVEASAAGYAPAFILAEVGPTRVDVVNVVLQATSTDVPYHELEKFEAYIECSYAQSLIISGGDFSCLGVVGLVTGIEIDNDVNNFPLRVNAGGFKGLLYEMVWQPTGTMTNYAGFLRSPVGVGQVGGLNQEQQFWVASGPSPLRAWVYQGIENEGAYDGDVFHPDPAVAGDYEILVSGVTSSTPEVAVGLQQRLDIFVTKFYHALGAEDYSVLDDA